MPTMTAAEPKAEFERNLVRRRLEGVGAEDFLAQRHHC